MNATDSLSRDSLGLTDPQMFPVIIGFIDCSCPLLRTLVQDENKSAPLQHILASGAKLKALPTPLYVGGRQKTE